MFEKQLRRTLYQTKKAISNKSVILSYLNQSNGNIKGTTTLMNVKTIKKTWNLMKETIEKF